MTNLSIRPIGGQQQAASLARQIGQFAGSRKGAAFAAAILLAGGGFAYVQESQKQQRRARQRWVSSDIAKQCHSMFNPSLLPLCLIRARSLRLYPSTNPAFAGIVSLMTAVPREPKRSGAHQLLCRTWSSSSCPLLARGSWCCLPSP